MHSEYEFGTTESCKTLHRMLDEYNDGMQSYEMKKMRKRISSNINGYFNRIRNLQKNFGEINEYTRHYIGQTLIANLDREEYKSIPIEIGYVIRNIKLAFIRDLFIHDEPLNYKR